MTTNNGSATMTIRAPVKATIFPSSWDNLSSTESEKPRNYKSAIQVADGQHFSDSLLLSKEKAKRLNSEPLTVKRPDQEAGGFRSQDNSEQPHILPPPPPPIPNLQSGKGIIQELIINRRKGHDTHNIRKSNLPKDNSLDKEEPSISSILPSAVNNTNGQYYTKGNPLNITCTSHYLQKATRIEYDPRSLVPISASKLTSISASHNRTGELVSSPSDGQSTKSTCAGLKDIHGNPPPNAAKTKMIKSIGDYELIRTIGSGSTAKVKLAINIRTNQKVAIKLIDRVKLAEQSSTGGGSSKESLSSKERRIIREAAILYLLDHPHIVKLHDFLILEDYFCLIFELVEGAQMLDYIISHRRLKEKIARKFFRQMVSAVTYLHVNSIVHRDLKIENVLVDRSGNARIVDFGLANFYDPRDQLGTFCGSLYFAAPELLCGRAYMGPEVDVWSLGVILYVLVCGKVPFDDRSLAALHEKIKACNLELPDYLSDECKDLLKQMIVADPKKRLSTEQLLDHSWTIRGYSSASSNSVNTFQLNFGAGSGGIGSSRYGNCPSSSSFASSYSLSTSSTMLQRRPLDFIDGRIVDYLTEEFRIQYSYQDIITVLKGSTEDWSSQYQHPIISLYFLVKEKLERDGTTARISSPYPNDHFRSSRFLEKANSCPNIFGQPSLQQNLNALSIKENAISLTGESVESSNTFASSSIPLSILSTPEQVVYKDKLTPITRGRNLSLTIPSTKATPFGRSMTDHAQSGEECLNIPPGKPFPTHSLPCYDDQVFGTEPTISQDSSKERFPSHRRVDSLLITNSELATKNRPLTRRPLPANNAGSTLDVLPEDEIACSSRGRKGSLMNPPPTSISSGYEDFHVKTVYLRGLFSVSTTSIKSAKRIIEEIRRSLLVCKVSFEDRNGYFICEEYYKSSLGSDRKMGEMDEGKGNDASKQTDDSLDVIIFEVHIVKLALLGLHGIQFKRVQGEFSQYKNTCSKILEQAKL